MTGSTDTDKLRNPAGEQPPLPFAEAELESNGPRLRPAELARLMGVSRQSVSEWIKLKKIRVGADGRVDPRQAVADMLKSNDPARLRARVLAPFAKEIAALRAQVARLTHELRECDAMREFFEGSADELAAIISRVEQLALSRSDVSESACDAIMAVIDPYEWKPAATVLSPGASAAAEPGESLDAFAGLEDSFDPATVTAVQAFGSSGGGDAGRMDDLPG